MTFMQSFDLNLWRVFDSVMELRNLNRAAERLGITQSAVSHALRRLRFALGDALFVRGPDGLRPTERAEQIAPSVHEALVVLRGARAQPSFNPAVSTKGFTIAAPNYFCLLVIPRLFSRVQAAAPGIAIHVVPVQEDLIVSLDRGSIDVALGATAVDVPARLVQEALYREAMVWISRRDHPAVRETFDPARLVSWPRVRISVPRPFRTLGEDTGDTLQLLPSRRLEAEAALATTTAVYDSLTAIAIAAQTDFLALIPKGIAVHAMSHEEIAILGEAPGLSREMAMLWHGQHRGDVAHKWLREQLLLTIGEISSGPGASTRVPRLESSIRIRPSSSARREAEPG
jgi:DNA-binding transcriptional LysR family regulator